MGPRHHQFQPRSRGSIPMQGAGHGIRGIPEKQSSRPLETDRAAGSGCRGLSETYQHSRTFSSERGGDLLRGLEQTTISPIHESQYSGKMFAYSLY